MRILVIHQYYLRPGDSGGSRFNEMTRMWREAGHEVEVIAGQVHYASGERPRTYVGKLAVLEEQNGVRVWRSYTPSTFHRSIRGRMLAFAGFALGATATLLWHAKRADVVIATSPSLLVLLPGLVARLALRTPLVFEVRDLWPESAVATGVLSARSPLTKALYGLEALGYRLANKIVVLTPAFKEDIVRRGLAPAEKIELIPNGADLELFQPGPPDPAVREKYGWGERFVVLYSGAHGIANHLSQYLETAELLKEREDILLVSVGDGPQRASLMAETERRGLRNLQWLPAVPKEEMPSLIRAADVGAAILKKVDTFKTVYPNKIFDYMACGRPVLCAIDGVARKLVEEAGAGVFVEPENPKDFAAKIVEMAEDPVQRSEMGQRARSYVPQHFSRTALAKRYGVLLAESV